MTKCSDSARRFARADGGQDNSCRLVLPHVGAPASLLGPLPTHRRERPTPKAAVASRDMPGLDNSLRPLACRYGKSAASIGDPW